MSVHELFCSSNISLTECLEYCKKNDFGNDFENDLKSLHSSDDFDFKIIDMNDLDFQIIQIW